MAKTFFSEIENLVAILPARQKGVFAFEVVKTHTPGTLPVVTKGLTAYATTLKAAVKEAGKYIETLKKAYEPTSIDLYFYMNETCIGIMTYAKGRQAVRCDFSGWAIDRATETEVSALQAGIATEIENGVISYTFSNEAETEKAVFECIEKGVKFNVSGRCSLIVYQAAPVTEAPTETEKEEKAVEVEIYHDGDTCYAMAGGKNPVVIGWVERWFNNTFAAGMQFGIKARKAIAIEELTGRDRAHHGFMTAENAKLWLVDQIRDYFRDHGYNLKVVNA